MNSLPALLPDPDAPARYQDAQASVRARRLLALSLLLHLAVIGTLVALDLRQPAQPAARDITQIALLNARPGDPQPVAPLPQPEQAPPALPLPPAEVAPQAADDTPLPAPALPVPPPQPPQLAGQADAGERGRVEAIAVDGMDIALFDHLRQRYLADLNRWFRARPLAYPEGARARGVEGLAIVNLSIDRDGNLLSLALSRSSGDSELDAAALAAVQRATPLPAPPAGIPYPVMQDIEIPVRFRLDQPR